MQSSHLSLVFSLQDALQQKYSGWLESLSLLRSTLQKLKSLILSCHKFMYILGEKYFLFFLQTAEKYSSRCQDKGMCR